MCNIFGSVSAGFTYVCVFPVCLVIFYTELLIFLNIFMGLLENLVSWIRFSSSSSLEPIAITFKQIFFFFDHPGHMNLSCNSAWWLTCMYNIPEIGMLVLLFPSFSVGYQGNFPCVLLWLSWGRVIVDWCFSLWIPSFT